MTEEKKSKAGELSAAPSAKGAPPQERAAAGAFPIVGVGASAGGLSAFEAFFSGMPPDVDPGMAFVLIQHLDPDHESILTELIRRYTRMQVFEVVDGVTVQPNCAYIIPPNRDMALVHGELQLLEPTAPRGQRLPIDFFFRSLAQDQHERAIGVVLSGTGSDGTQGLRAIKGEGGMAMAQSPQSSDFAGMPTAAIATGLVDYQLSPAEMAPQILSYVKHAFGTRSAMARREGAAVPSAQNQIFHVLRTQTGHDFSQYKANTIQRRIERRMSVHQLDTHEAYLRYLMRTPAEVDALFHDLLIGVTSFFRDPGTFECLANDIIPRILRDREPDSEIRVWVPGCSTGEEAYSIAILFMEQQEALESQLKVQIFATDIDGDAIAKARAGRYPTSIAADVSAPRLSRFFTAEADGSSYSVRRGLREMIGFSEQDVIKDPPFSRLDLVCCRNLLIYLSSELQSKLIPLFHYALRPGGFLFLGSSESVGEHAHLFETVDRKRKLYRRRDDVQGSMRAALGAILPSVSRSGASPPLASVRTPAPKARTLRELTERALLQHLPLAAALVDPMGLVLYLHGRTGAYLEPVPGAAGASNILKMAREGLQRPLAVALHQAATSQKSIHQTPVHVRTNGDFTWVSLTVRPLSVEPQSPPATPSSATPSSATPSSATPSSATPSSATPLFIVILEETAPPTAPQQAGTPAGPEGSAALGEDTTAQALVPEAHERLAVLREELRAKDEYLRAANEELETSNEELRTSNEELQSINEELETSKEELQSVNEELSTVNAELQTKVLDLSRANNDMNNLLAGTGIGTIFVDLQLRLVRFTPAATRIISLRQRDVGRSLAEIVTSLVGYDRMLLDTQDVLDTLVSKEIEVNTRDGSWFAMRIMPYRTVDNVIEGAVLTFVDITVRKQVEEHVVQQARVLAIVHDAVTTMDDQMLLTSWNVTVQPHLSSLGGYDVAGSRLGVGVPALCASRVSAMKRRTLRPCLRQLAVAVRTRSTKVEPASVRDP